MAYRFYTRRWLNRAHHHSHAHVLAYCEDTSAKKKNPGWLAILFDISDCSRTISLEFEIETKADFENSLYKIDTLTSTLQAMRKALVAERALYVKRKHSKDS